MNKDGQQDTSGQHRFIITQERSYQTSGTFGFTGNDQHDYAATSVTASANNPINIYLVYLNNPHDNTPSNKRGQITFDHQIIGIYNKPTDTVAMSNASKPGATYPPTNKTISGFNNRSEHLKEIWSVSDNKTLTGKKGDFDEEHLCK